MAEIKLGVEAKDLVTGFTGIVVSEITHLHGGREMKLQRQTEDSQKYPPSEWVAEGYLEKVGEGVHIEPVKREFGFQAKKGSNNG